MLILQPPKRLTRRPRVTVCGSFRRFLPEIKLTIEELCDHGALVLSPKRPIPYGDIGGDFMLIEGDRDRLFSNPHNIIRETEDRHLDCIRYSNFVVVVCPGGYIGESVALEIGAARGWSVPCYTQVAVRDDKHCYLVTAIPTIELMVLNHTIMVLEAQS